MDTTERERERREKIALEAAHRIGNHLHKGSFSVFFDPIDKMGGNDPKFFLFLLDLHIYKMGRDLLSIETCKYNSKTLLMACSMAKLKNANYTNARMVCSTSLTP